MNTRKYILPDLQHLRTFLAVVDAGGFSKASQVLHMTQPNVTNHIRKLEEFIGVVLIERSRRPLVPTSAGQKMLDLTRRILHETTEVIETIRLDSNSVKGWIHIGATESLANFLIQQQRNFSAINPGLHLAISCKPNQGVIHDLKSGLIDIGFVSKLMVLDNINFEELFSDDLVLIIGNKNQATSRIEHVKDLYEIPYIDYPDGTHKLLSWAGHNSFDEKIDISKINYTSFVNTISAVVELVMQGYGIAVVPLSIVKQHIYSRRISIVPGRVTSAPKLTIYCVERQNATKNSRVITLKNFLSTTFTTGKQSNAAG
jgi:DNA-binding transcriptional LysR family regulator